MAIHCNGTRIYYDIIIKLSFVCVHACVGVYVCVCMLVYVCRGVVIITCIILFNTIIDLCLWGKWFWLHMLDR